MINSADVIGLSVSHPQRDKAHDVDVPLCGDISPLHTACFGGDVTAVKAMIDAGADVNAVTYTAAQVTPLHDACLGGHLPIVRTRSSV